MYKLFDVQIEAGTTDDRTSNSVLRRLVQCAHRNFFSSDLNEIWYVGRGRWVMHDGMPYGQNQGQG